MAKRAPEADPGCWLHQWLAVGFPPGSRHSKSKRRRASASWFWAITEQDELALDRYEGFPRVYSKTNINGAMTYVMNSIEIAPPSPIYFATIEQGYQDFGLKTDHLVSALYEVGGVA